FAWTLIVVAFSNATAVSVSAERRLPAEYSRTTSSAPFAEFIMAPIASVVVMSRPYMLRPRLVGVWEEQLLSLDLIVCDRLVTLGRDEPVDEGLAEFFLDVGMLGRIHQHHAILIEQPLVAGDQDVQVAAVLERQPGAAIGEHVSVRC